MLSVGHGDGGRYYTEPARADYYAAGGESAAPKLDFFTVCNDTEERTL